MSTKQIRKNVIGVFHNRLAADSCFNDLLRQGYLSSDINIMMTDRTRSQDYAWGPDVEALAMQSGRSMGTEAGTMAAQGVGVGGSIGTAVGATLAAIAAVGTSLVIPGLNLIVAGPIMAALAGGGAGAITGGLVGGLVGLGIPEQNASVYNKALQEGGVVMSVVADSTNVREIENLMLNHSGEEVACTTSYPAD